MGNPLFDKKPIKETIAYKVSLIGIRPLSKEARQNLEKNARIPYLRKHFPIIEDFSPSSDLNSKL